MVDGTCDTERTPTKRQFFMERSLHNGFTQLHGKELSYNNLLDNDAAVQLIAELEAPSAVVLKHNTPCGVARAMTYTPPTARHLRRPYFGFRGIIAVNREVDRQVAEKDGRNIFLRYLLPPSYTKRH